MAEASLRPAAEIRNDRRTRVESGGQTRPVNKKGFSFRSVGADRVEAQRGQLNDSFTYYAKTLATGGQAQ